MLQLFLSFIAHLLWLRKLRVRGVILLKVPSLYMDDLIPKPSKFILLHQRKKKEKIERGERTLGERGLHWVLSLRRA